MGSIVNSLYKRPDIDISPPKALLNNIHYECIMGSVAYGVSDNYSDMDIYGFCIPEKDVIFPHLRGEIQGFGKKLKRFDQYQQHHIEDKSKKRIYDITIYNIVKYFQLCMENNPNMIDSLFVPHDCILSITQVGQIVRENRRIFLHKGCWHKFKGYAYSQMHKMKIKNPEGKRKELVEKYGYDIKFAYHVVRLLNEVEQILGECDLDLRRNTQQLRYVKEGKWSMEQVIDYFNTKEKTLEELYQNSKLPYSPNESRIKEILLNCLEQHCGSLDKIINKKEDKYKNAVDDIISVIDKL